MAKNKSIHFCGVQANIGEEICCQLIRLLNVPEKVPFCPPSLVKIGLKIIQENSTAFESNEHAENRSATPISTLFQRSYPKYGPPAQPINLKVAPEDAPEEHLTFLFGVFMLISMAVICTLFLMKLAKAGSDDSNYRINGRGLGSILPSDYSVMFLFPGNRGNSHRAAAVGVHRVRRTPSTLMVLLRSSFRCGAGSNASSTGPNSIPCSDRSARSTTTTTTTGTRRVPRSGRSCVSIVSSSSMNALLPNAMTPSSSSGSAGLAGLAALNASTSTPSALSTAAIQPPPCYEELEEFTSANKE